jgi:preprotein translocase subunit SecF
LAEEERRAAGVSLGVTGLPAYALDDRDVIQRDVSRLSLVSFALVLALFATAFGAFRRPLLAMVSLLLAVAATLGLAALHPGHLTLLSAFFASILFGLGVDFGIHLVDRVEELTGDGATEAEALPRAMAGLGPGLATGALTTAGAFFALAFCGFRGFAELGTIAGAGVLVCLLATATVLPALLVTFPPRRRRERPPRQRRLGRLLLALQRRPVAAAVGAACLLAPLAARPGFDSDYLNLQPEGSETVRLEREMVRRTAFSPQFAALVAPGRAAAAELAARLAAEPAVGTVRSAADLDALAFLPVADPAALAALRAGFVAADGRHAVYAYPQGDVWDPAERDRFLAAVRRVDPAATGMPVLGELMIDRSRRALRVGATLGSAVVLLFVAADFRRLRPALLAVVPTAAGAAATLALMRLLGVRFNPLNVMALPVVLGIAVDDGVHLVHRWIAERGDLARTLAGTGRSVVLTSATSLAAFGSLAFTRHRGLASFAVVLCLGVGSALAASVLLLPRLLALALPPHRLCRIRAMHPSLQTSYDALERRKRDLLSPLSALSAEQLAFRPAADAWSLVEVADHLLRTEAAVLLGLEKGLPAHKRRPTLRQRLLRPLIGVALRLPLRIKVPTPVVAPRSDRTLDEVEAEWAQVRAALLAKLASLDPARLGAPVILHPIGGPMDVVRTLGFLGAHIDHHVHQVRRLRSHPGFPAAA